MKNKGLQGTKITEWVTEDREAIKKPPIHELLKWSDTVHKELCFLHLWNKFQALKHWWNGNCKI